MCPTRLSRCVDQRTSVLQMSSASFSCNRLRQHLRTCRSGLHFWVRHRNVSGRRCGVGINFHTSVLQAPKKFRVFRTHIERAPIFQQAHQSSPRSCATACRSHFHINLLETGQVLSADSAHFLNGKKQSSTTTTSWMLMATLLHDL